MKCTFREHYFVSRAVRSGKVYCRVSFSNQSINQSIINFLTTAICPIYRDRLKSTHEINTVIDSRSDNGLLKHFYVSLTSIIICYNIFSNSRCDTGNIAKEGAVMCKLLAIADHTCVGLRLANKTELVIILKYNVLCVISPIACVGITTE